MDWRPAFLIIMLFILNSYTTINLCYIDYLGVRSKYPTVYIVYIKAIKPLEW